MIVVLSFCAQDARNAVRLLEWIYRLSSKQAFSILLVTDDSTPFDSALQVFSAAEKVFEKTFIITCPATSGWPQGANAQWRAASDWCRKHKHDWLWLEPDSIPLRASWLTEINQAWEQRASGVRFLGYIYNGEKQFTDRRFMSGIAVYDSSIDLTPVSAAWDVEFSETMVSSGQHTGLVRHFFGQIDLAPRFVPDGHPRAINEFNLSWIGEEAVIFHRDKSQSLIPLLRRKLFPNERLLPLIKVVFPVHGGDIAQALHHAQWLRQLSAGCKWQHEAVLAFDKSCPVVALNGLEAVLRQCFEVVTTLVYERPPFPGWPAAANWMFQNISWRMMSQKHSWLLLEADACVLRRDWLEQLQEDYELCGAKFFGPHVKGMQHANGMMVYPPETPELIPSAMNCSDQAWDYICSREMMADCADASHLLQHCWTILNGEACEVGGGELPQNITLEQARRWIKPGTIIFHRLKGNSLIDLLMTGAYVHG